MTSAAAAFAALGRAMVLALALAATLAGLAAWGGAISVKLDALTHFTPLGFLLCVMAAVAAKAMRRRGPRAAFPLALAGALIWGALAAPELVAAALAQRAQTGAGPLKIIQFNTWARTDRVDDKLAWIRREDPDAIVFEEIADAGQPMLKALAAAYPTRLTCENPPYPCSVVILAKRPAIAAGHFNTPSETQPNVTWGRFDGPGGPYTLMATHVGWPTPDGRQQRHLATLAKEIAGFDRATLVLAGDFNSAPWSFSLRRFDRVSRLSRRTRALFTWPTPSVAAKGLRLPLPFLPIDQVYAGEAWRTLKVARGPNLGSDHYPVVVTLARGRP